MKNILIFVHLALPLLCFAQNSALQVFEPLLGKTWTATGTWGDGSKFYQKSIFEYDLDSTLVVVHSSGYTDKEQKVVGPRSHGLRQVDLKTGRIVFWEFDVFGGLTQGVVYAEDQDLRYEYNYGETLVTDLWEHADDSTYSFTVGIWSEGVWKQKFLETTFQGE